MISMDRPLTVKEAADFLKVTPQKVRDYIKANLLKAYKIGNGTGKSRSTSQWRIYEDDLVDFIKRSSNIKRIS
jgi:excisionase family DNA binding protein